MNHLSRRELLKASIMGGASMAFANLVTRAGAADAPAAAKNRPNIVFILSDDYGIDGVSCYGSDRFKGKTPNLDALAAGGIRFERCHSTPLCGPTRCQIMTGRYPFRTGGLTNQMGGVPQPQDEVSFAKVLKQAGYATCSAGKWRQMSSTPGAWGFDEYVTDPNAAGYYWKNSCTKNGKEIPIPEGTYYPDFCHDFAMDFMARQKDKPFLLYYASHLIHGKVERTPDAKEPSLDAYVAYLDKQVGKVVAEIDRLGLREKTVIIFSGDNGMAKQSGTIGGRRINGQKGSMQEGGVRVPLIANWKGTAPAGTVMKDMIDFTDLFPTFAELGNAKLPEGVTLDGRSFAPRLRGQKGNPREWVFVQLGAHWYAKDDGWKLNQAGELFDMKDAPFIEKPVPADTTDETAKAARKRLQAVLDQLNPAAGKTVKPTADKPAQPAAGAPKRKKKRAQTAPTPATPGVSNAIPAEAASP